MVRILFKEFLEGFLKKSVMASLLFLVILNGCSSAMFGVSPPLAPEIKTLGNVNSSTTNNLPQFNVYANSGVQFQAGESVSIHISNDCSDAPLVSTTLSSASNQVTLQLTNPVPPNTQVDYYAQLLDSNGIPVCSGAGSVNTYAEYEYLTPPQSLVSLVNPLSSPGVDSTPSFQVSLPSGWTFFSSDTINIYNGPCNTGVLLASIPGTQGALTQNYTLSSALTLGAGVNIYAEIVNPLGDATCSNNFASYVFNSGATPDTTPPSSASSLAWVPGASPTNSAGPFGATWIPGTDANFSHEDIEFHNNASCSSQVGATVSPASSPSSFSPPSDGSYYFQVHTYDLAGNLTSSTCHGPLTIDTTAPAVPSTGLVWQETSPHNAVNVNATWGAVTGSSSYKVQFYSDGTCSVASGALVPATASPLAFTGVNNGKYSFKVSSVDALGNTSALSVCSNEMHILSGGPTNATSLAWNPATPNPRNVATAATWNQSTDSNYASEALNFYSNAGCTTNADAANTVTAPNFLPASDGTYYFGVTTTDSAGNTSLTCSPAMAFDFTNPVAPATASLVWSPATSPVASLGVHNASWTIGTDANYSHDQITFYSGATCATQVLAPVTATPLAPFTATVDGDYYFKITSYDTAGNSATSACSAVKTIDTTAPAVPSTSLVWQETSPHNAVNVNATWGAVPGASSYKVQFYSDGTCSAATGALVPSTTSPLAFTGANNEKYSFKVSSVDALGNTSALSVCSNEMHILSSGPTNATSLVWNPATPNPRNVATAADWVQSTDSNYASEALNFYSNAGCTTNADAANTVTAPNFLPASDGTYYFGVTTTDSAGNTSLTCSPAMAFDFTNPVAPATASLIWSPATSPVGSLGVHNASWTIGTDANYSHDQITFYSGATCATQVLAPVTATPLAPFTATVDGDYYFKITSYDTAGNSATSACSAVKTIDTTAPAVPNTGLVWQETSPHNTVNVNATWGAVIGASSYKVQFYSDGTCSAASGALVPSTASPLAFTGVNNGKYSFKVSSVDALGNTSALSVCSNEIHILSGGPTNATSLAWSPATPNPRNVATVATWNQSTDSNYASEALNFYSNAGCTTNADAANTVTAPNFLPASDGTYYFGVTTTDSAGNTSLVCSPAMAFDFTNPIAPATASLVWSPATSPVGSLGVHNASWTIGTDANYSHDQITFYSGATCATQVLAPVTATPLAPFTATVDGDYYFKITSYDTAGNSATSACSAVKTIDITAPAVPTTSNGGGALAWLETSPQVATSTITATWDNVLTASDYKVEFFSGSGCTTSLGAPSSVAAAGGTATNLVYPGAKTVGSIYTFKVAAVDALGNTSNYSGCSADMLIQATGPMPQNWTWNFEEFPNNDLNGDNNPFIDVSAVPSADHGATFKIYEDSSCTLLASSLWNQSTVNGGGISNFDFISYNASDNGQHSYYVIASKGGVDSPCVNTGLNYYYQNAPLVVEFREIAHSHIEQSSIVESIEIILTDQAGNPATLPVNFNVEFSINNHYLNISPMSRTGLSLTNNVVSIPAGSSSAFINYTYSGDSLPKVEPDLMHLTLSKTDDYKILTIGRRNIHRALYRDEDGMNEMLEISAGNFYNCGITAINELFCWGSNRYGQLGDGSLLDSSIPKSIGSGFVQVSAGTFHACAIDTADELFCWGLNNNRQLGDGTTANSLVPISIGTDFKAVSAGVTHTCAIDNTNELFCWGRNNYGQLGDGSTLNKSIPVSVGTNFVTVSTAEDHSCGIDTAGELFCWGRNNYGQLGDGTTTSSLLPKSIGTGFKAVVAGTGNTCAITSADDLYCWGNNTDGKLGDGSTVSSSLPILILNGILEVDTGSRHTCAVDTSNDLFCWGGNYYGQLGDGSTTRKLVPTYIASNYLKLSIGNPPLIQASNHTCGLTMNGELFCWGSNYSGLLGDAVVGQLSSPSLITGNNYASVSISREHACAIDISNELYCWGDNLYGELGVGSVFDSSAPVSVGSGFLELSTPSDGGASYHSCAIDTSNELFCWGRNGAGQLGIGSGSGADTSLPVSVGVGFESVSTGTYHTCAINTALELLCWGKNNYGQLGDGSTTGAYSPISVGSGYKKVAVGYSHTCAIKVSGELFCWGHNEFGKLGDGTTSSSLSPVSIGFGYSDVNLGFFHTCAIKTSGELFCWGRNNYGQLGDGTVISSSVPVSVGIGYSSVSVGNDFSCAIDNLNELFCWGRNNQNQLGNGTIVNSNVPFSVGINYKSVSASAYRACAINTSNDLFCWGLNGSSGLGLSNLNSENNASSSYVPIPIW